MSEGLRATDVKEALALFVARDGYEATVMAAARAWLASQEQTPDYEAAERKLNDHLAYWENTGMISVNSRTGIKLAVVEVVDAALVGFHPQPIESPEVPT